MNIVVNSYQKETHKALGYYRDGGPSGAWLVTGVIFCVLNAMSRSNNLSSCSTKIGINGTGLRVPSEYHKIHSLYTQGVKPEAVCTL